MKSYHRRKITAVDQLHFFSGSLHARLPPVAHQFTVPRQMTEYVLVKPQRRL
jgi:hypothetical protein